MESMSKNNNLPKLLTVNSLPTKMFRNWSFVSLVKIKIGIEIKYYKFEIRDTSIFQKRIRHFVRIFLIFPCILDCLRWKSYPRTVKCDNVNAILVEIYGIIWYKIFSWGWSELLVWNLKFLDFSGFTETESEIKTKSEIILVTSFIGNVTLVLSKDVTKAWQPLYKNWTVCISFLGSPSHDLKISPTVATQ